MLRSWFTPVARVAAPLALAIMAACGSDSSTGPSDGSGLTAAQKTAISTTLGRQDIRQLIFPDVDQSVAYGLAKNSFLGLSGLGAISFGSAPSGNRLVRASQLVLGPRATTIAGPTGAYTTFGAQLVMTDSEPPNTPSHDVWTGLVAFDNLDNPTTIIIVGVLSHNVTSVTSFPSAAFDLTDESKFGVGTYIKLTSSTASTVYSTTAGSSSAGSMAITNASFSGSTSCGARPTFVWSCTYGSGNLTGSFSFTATQVNGTDTVTIPTTTFDVLASQTTINFSQAPFLYIW